MTKLTDIFTGTKNKVSTLQLITTLLFLALFAFPLFPLKVVNAILTLLSLFTLIAFISKPFPIGKTIFRNLIFIVPFLPYLVEFIISGSDPTAHFEFEKKLFFFTAPLMIPVFLQYSSLKNHRIPLLIFSISVCTLSVYSIIALSVNGIPFSHSAYENGAYLLRENFENISGLHPTYYSLFAITAACFLFRASSNAKGMIRILYFIFVFILLIFILFLAVRIAFVTGIIFLLIWIINIKTGWFKKIMLGISMLAMLAMISYAIPSLSNRMGEFISWEQSEASSDNTVSHRATILNCSLKIFSSNIFFGTGSRNFQKKLNDCYASKGWETGSSQNYNPHNQYLSMGVNYGLVIMIIFIFFLFFVFRKIFKIPEGKYFGIAILVFFLSESLLERQMGVYFFGLISLLLYNICPDSSAKNPVAENLND